MDPEGNDNDKTGAYFRLKKTLLQVRGKKIESQPAAGLALSLGVTVEESLYFDTYCTK